MGDKVEIEGCDIKRIAQGLSLHPSQLVNYVGLNDKDEVICRWGRDRKQCAIFVCVAASIAWMVIAFLAAESIESAIVVWLCVLVPAVVLCVWIDYKREKYIDFLNKHIMKVVTGTVLTLFAYTVLTSPEDFIRGFDSSPWKTAYSAIAMIVLITFSVLMVASVGAYTKLIPLASKVYLSVGAPVFSFVVFQMNHDFEEWVKKEHPDWVDENKEPIINLWGMKDSPSRAYKSNLDELELTDSQLVSKNEFLEIVAMRLLEETQELRAKEREEQDIKDQRERDKLDRLLQRSAESSPLKHKNPFS